MSNEQVQLSGVSTGRDKDRRSFTLIELLVVIAIILILMGISLKMMNVVTQKTGTAKTLYILEQTRNALDAYYAVIGAYPNTTANHYSGFNGKGTESWGFDATAQVKSNEVYGLTYYIGFDNSHPRYSSWQKFVKNVSPPVIVSLGFHTNPVIAMAGFDGIITTNDVYGIWDAWDRSIGYEPNANCDGYILWSNGPDGVRNTKDDLGIAQNE